MNQLFYKISFYILVIACLILAIDEVHMGLRLERVSSQIAERTKEMKEKIRSFRQQTETAKAYAEKQKNLFHLIAYPELKENQLPNELPQRLAANGKEASAVREIMTRLPADKRDPAAVLTEVRRYWTEKQKNEKWRIYPETGTMQTLYASILTETAQNCGFSTQTKFYWHLPDCKLTTMVIIQDDLKQKKVISGEIPPEPYVVQKTPESMIFPFTVIELGDEEQEFFKQTEERRLPLGRCYVHLFRSKDTGDWLLDYELKEEEQLSQTNLRAFSLLQGSEIQSASNGAVRTFKISPDANGETLFMVFSDQPVFVRRITGVRAKVLLPGSGNQDTLTPYSNEKDKAL